ncbi:phosphotransferase family protein [Streptomyces shenzhenensis]|uniref:phosphotransferase family protein n=1 Tax=Streptomyces shenzhenensis TaxID=943815 RepID=UPI001F41117C|nr:aminoglycoside phosphotransferase family protein [Streptomyces shenzhenensis]
MTTTASAESAARMACRASGLADQSLTRLHEHATSVFLLADEGIVVRVSSLSQRPRLDTAVSLTRWLVTNGFPATEPADLPQPLVYDPHAVTFWHHYPQPEGSGPPAGSLGVLLRELHSLPAPPIPLPRFQPLTSFKSSVESSCYLSSPQREWLAARREDLLDSYGKLDFPLGQGHIHGDAYPGNTLWGGDGVRLGDWDEAAFGPREIDLANTFQGVRFGRTAADLDEFSLRYGYDIRRWDGLPVLRAMRDLHTLGAFIRRADRGDRAAGEQLSHRIATLVDGSETASWSTA